MKRFLNGQTLIAIVFFFSSLFIVFFFLPNLFGEKYVYQSSMAQSVASQEKSEISDEIIKFEPSYIATPDPLKAVYMTSWVASEKVRRSEIVKIIDETEVNAVVIDIKDYSGKIVFKVESPELKSFGSEEVRIRDIREFLEELHQKQIYVIARLAVFQDQYFASHRPDLAVKNKSGEKVWKDRKGLTWIDPASREYWDYIILISKEARKVGFDEINFDYIRFPSDGDMLNISYSLSSTTPREIVIESFFSYLQDNLSGTGLKISADIFGMVTTITDNDMGIGQVLETALPYFDYVSPMIYPSHYSSGFEGFKNPEEHPYEVVNISLKKASERATMASTSPKKIRPWLQDFGLKVFYGSNEVRAQIRAVNDAGLNSWMLWSPSNRYTKNALEPA
jgi:hypothetical protein